MDGLHRDEAAFFDVAHEGAQIRAVAQALTEVDGLGTIDEVTERIAQALA